MKVLIACNYIYRKEWPEFTRNRTGYGIMVNDIFESVSENIDTYLISHVINMKHGKVLRHTWGDVIVNARPKDWIKGFNYFFSYNQRIQERVKYFYYGLNSGAIRKAIRSIKPDLVHIHGIGIPIKPFLDACEEEDVPYIVTLHGLIGLDDTVLAAQWDKLMEKSFLIEADKKGIPVTVISSGIKKRIEEKYLCHKASNITVVCNGTNISKDNNLDTNEDYMNLRKKYNLSDEKIVVVIGSVCERKNQIQIVRAMATGKIKTKCHVFMCGADTTNGEVQRIVDEYKLDTVIHFLGFLSRRTIVQILNQADLNVVASRDEGFGLSIIEGFSYGVPSVTFSDLDAIEDVYDNQSMVIVEGRSDDALAQGIEKALTTRWDKQRIAEYSKRFSLSNMAKLYQDEYDKLLTK